MNVIKMQLQTRFSICVFNFFLLTKRFINFCLILFKAASEHVKKIDSPCLATPTVDSARRTPKFSLSKLSKFVSRSTLSVISRSGMSKSSNGRKSLGSQCSSASISMDEDELDEATPQVESEAQKSIKLNLEKLIDSYDEQQPKTSWSYQPIKQTKVKPMAASSNKRPCMGLTALMLANLKRNNPSVSYANCMPNVYLIGVPHVFKTESLPAAQTSNDNQVSNNTYDHLSAVKPKPSRFQKNKSCSNAVRLAKTSEAVIATANTAVVSPKAKISVYTKRHFSAVNLNESQQYDSIIF